MPPNVGKASGGPDERAAAEPEAAMRAEASQMPPDPRAPCERPAGEPQPEDPDAASDPVRVMEERVAHPEVGGLAS